MVTIFAKISILNVWLDSEYVPHKECIFLSRILCCKYERIITAAEKKFDILITDFIRSLCKEVFIIFLIIIVIQKNNLTKRPLNHKVKHGSNPLSKQHPKSFG